MAQGMVSRTAAQLTSKMAILLVIILFLARTAADGTSRNLLTVRSIFNPYSIRIEIERKIDNIMSSWMQQLDDIKW